MGSIKVNIKKSAMALVSTLLVLLLVVLAYPVQAADANKEYAISFRGGEGTIQVADTGAVNESYTVKVPYEGTVDLSIITALPPTGYYFTGWSPEVETTVTEKANYVAQYARIINEGVYRVRYMDHYGNELATQRAAITNVGVDVTEYALPIDGYVVDAASKTVNIATAKGTQIDFIYTSEAEANPTEVIQTVVLPGGTTIVTTGGVTAGTVGTDGTTATTATGQDGQRTTDNTTNQQGQTTTLDENDVPLANQDLQKDSGGASPWVYAGIGVMIILSLGGAFLFIRKRHRS
ncbi:hypothetical protein [Eubacterium barkeri]|uniref:Uncharacterized protein n=1 Tax=Eubacterium barkeri TaxID=1528 RepID=A0A1H3GNL4_EUBBA|nr:hypothetical protein [Eubacterium barkeri]SDY04565.1 hypothetical protein SAMN04488579_11459 [Eubacterium barkeri]